VSEIQCVLNSIKDGQIGGRVYFLTPHGVIVGQSGVVNVGSLQLLTPTEAFMSSFFDGGGEISTSAVSAVCEGSVPISPTGLVRVDGRIRAVTDVEIEAGSVHLDGVIGTGAVFSWTEPDFTDVLNLSGLDAGAHISVENGDIKIVAANDVVIDEGTLYTDGSEGVDAGKIGIEAGRLIQIGTGALLSAEGHGADSADGDIELRAVSKSSSDGMGALAAAEIDVQGGEIRGGSILLRAEADADYHWDGGSPIRIGGGDFLGPEMQGQDVTIAQSSATSEVKIAGGAVLRSSGKLL